MMILTILVERIAVAAFGGLFAAIVAISLCRIPNLHPGIKTWACRLALLKFPLGLFLGASVPVGNAPSQASWVTPAVCAYLLAAWLAGAVVVLLHSMASYRSAAQLIRKAPEGGALDEAKGLAVRVVSGLPEPCVVGVLNPLLAVPDRGRVEPEIIRHEVAHVRHGDPIFGFLAWSVYSLFWFVPGLSRLTFEHGLWQEVWADLDTRRALNLSPRDQANALLEAAKERLAAIPSAALGYSGEAGTMSIRIRAMFVERHSLLCACAAILLAVAATIPLRPAPVKSEGLIVSPAAARVLAVPR